MTTVLSDDVARFVHATGPDPDEVLVEMDQYATSEGFPHVGPDVGGLLQLLARLTDANRIFEFGSGFGYSAYWFARGMAADGEIVLTDRDEMLLDRARTYLDRGGHGNLATYESGDALETIGAYDEPFDVVLLDHEKSRYVEAFEAAMPLIPVGGAVVADNVMRADVIDFDSLLDTVERRATARHGPDGPTFGSAGDPEPTPDRRTVDRADLGEHTRGIADYLEAVRSRPDFETVVLPLGEGIAVSYRVD